MNDWKLPLTVVFLMGYIHVMSPVLAQEAGVAGGEEVDAPEPRSPLIPPAPARAEWTVSYSHEFDSSWQDVMGRDRPGDGMENNEEGLLMRSLDVSKDAQMQTYRLRTRYNDGSNEEEWIVMGYHVAERPGGRGLYVVGAEGVGAQQLVQGDFPELNWVKMEHYQGVKTFRGKPVHVFSVAFDSKQLTPSDMRIFQAYLRDNPNATPSMVLEPKVEEVVLFIDVETQFPVLYNDGRTIHSYRFSQPTNPRLRPPARIVNFLQTREEELARRLAPPAGPGSP